MNEPALPSASALASEAAVERRELGIEGLRDIVFDKDRDGVAAEARWDRFFSFSWCESSSLLLSSAVLLCCLSLLVRDVHR